MISSTSDAEVKDSSSDESEISSAWDATEEIESLPQYGTYKHTKTVMRHVNNLVHCYVSVQKTTQIGSHILKKVSWSLAGYLACMSMAW